MKTRTTKHSFPTVPKAVTPVDASLLEKLFDQAPDVAFFIKDAAALDHFENNVAEVAGDGRSE